MASKRKKKSVVGVVIYWILLAAFAVVLVLGCKYLLGDVQKYLIAYENAQPDATIEAYMKTLKSDIFDDQIRQLAASKPHPFQTNEECEQIIRNELGGNLTYQRAGAASSSGTRYNLYCSSDPEKGYYQIGSVTLRQDTSRIREVDIGILGNYFNRESLCPWTVSENIIDLSAFATMTSLDITLPESYTVYINGKLVGNEYLVEKGIHYSEFEQYYADHPGLPTKARYLVQDQIFGVVEPQIYDNNGNLYEMPAEKKEENYVWNGNTLTITINDLVRLPITDAEMAELKNFADSFISPYLNYFGTKHVDSNAGALRQLIVPGCDIDKRMTEFLAGAQYIHYYSLQINNYSFDDAFSLGDGFYAIDVSYDATAYSEYKTVQQASTLRIVVVRTDQGLKAISAE